MGKVFLTTPSQLCLVTSCCNQRVLATTLQYIVAWHKIVDEVTINKKRLQIRKQLAIFISK